MIKRHYAISLLVLCLVLAGSVGASGESPRRLNNEGVNLYQKNRFGDAVEKFEQARKTQPDNPILAYNQGISEAMRKQWEKAISCFNEANEARNPHMARTAQFALGYSHFQRARQQMQEGNLEEALKSAQASVSAGQSALLADTKDLSARHNLDLALRLKNEIQEKMKQQQQQQQQQQQKNQPSKQKEDQNKQNASSPMGQDGTPTPAPTPSPSPNASNQGSEPNQRPTPTPQPQSADSTGNKMDHRATPTASQTSGKPTQPQTNNATPKPDDTEKPSPQRATRSRSSEGPIERDALESILNVLDDDREALRQMRKQKAGTIAEPAKGW